MKQMAKRKSGSSLCDHLMFALRLDAPQIRACFKCRKHWPREHPRYSEKQIAEVIDFAIFISAHEKKRSGKILYTPISEEREERDIDLL